MSTVATNPALQAFICWIESEQVLGQVLIRRLSEGFELRHALDREAAALKVVPISELRHMAQFTSAGQYRPLKSAPDLQRAWRTLVQTPSELEMAINSLYPGAIADWFSVQQGSASVTHYRAFSNRQTGMYRITQS